MLLLRFSLNPTAVLQKVVFSSLSKRVNKLITAKFLAGSLIAFSSSHFEARFFVLMATGFSSGNSVTAAMHCKIFHFQSENLQMCKDKCSCFVPTTSYEIKIRESCTIRLRSASKAASLIVNGFCIIFAYCGAVLIFIYNQMFCS